MNSRNMPEEEDLDHLFRQAADSFEPEFDPEAWRQMEQKLAATSRKPAILGKWTKRTLLALLLFLSGVVVYRFAARETAQTSGPVNTTRSKAPALSKAPEPTTPETSVAGNQERLSAKKLAEKTPIINLPATGAPTVQPTRGRQRPTKPLPVTKPTVANRPGRRNSKFNRNPVLWPAMQSAAVPGTKSIFKNDSIKADVPTVVEVDKNNPAVLPGVNNSNLDSTARQAELQTGIIPDSKVASRDSVKTPTTAATDSALKKAPVTFLSNVTVSLVFGPDFSTVKFVRPEKASTNVGVLLSYSFNQRWTITSGVVRARKVYGAKPEDYHMKPGYWPAGQHLPDEINAVCKVVDIPVNVRYAVVALPRQSIYVQTGLSSYVMLHEDYRYDYSNYGKPYSKHWIVSNQNRHFFQVLNLSVGYSKQIKPGISVGAEPFVKIPLAGVGAGKVNLASLGAFFSVSYRFR